MMDGTVCLPQKRQNFWGKESPALQRERGFVQNRSCLLFSSRERMPNELTCSYSSASAGKTSTEMGLSRSSRAVTLS